MNFARDVVDAAPPGQLALVTLDEDGRRERLSFGEVAERSARLAGTLADRGVQRGDLVMTLLGNRPELVLALVACFRIGAVALPCSEQLRATDLRARMALAPPRLVIADRRNGAELERAGYCGPLLLVPDRALFGSAPAPAPELAPHDPALVIFTSGTSGEPRPIRHGQRYLEAQRVQAEHWLDARPGELCWCTGASGWSKSVRNAFVAPWLRGAAALLQDRRFDAAERLATLAEEKVDVLCMAPTEYRAVAKRVALRRLPHLRHAVAAGEPLNPEVIVRWRDEAGVLVQGCSCTTATGRPRPARSPECR